MSDSNQPYDPRRRLRELNAIPDRDRTDEEWDELNELEIQLAPCNRIGAPPAEAFRQGKAKPQFRKEGNKPQNKPKKNFQNGPKPQHTQNHQNAGQGGQGHQGSQTNAPANAPAESGAAQGNNPGQAPRSGKPSPGKRHFTNKRSRGPRNTGDQANAGSGNGNGGGDSSAPAAPSAPPAPASASGGGESN